VDEVKRLRLEKGWSQNELAYHAKLAPSVISLIETGKRDPNATTLRKLAEALEVRIPDLFEESGSGKAPRRSSPEPSLNDVLEEERQIAAAKTFTDNLNHFAQKWREEAKAPEEQGVYWCVGVQATAIGLTDVLSKLGLIGMIGRKIGEVGKQNPSATPDPDARVFMDLLTAFEDMHEASDHVLEVAETVDWITIKEAEQRRKAFSVIQGDLSA
jgi:transcriptional regulator with XRE-family HTH domain